MITNDSDLIHAQETKERIHAVLEEMDTIIEEVDAAPSPLDEAKLWLSHARVLAYEANDLLNHLDRVVMGIEYDLKESRKG